MIQKFAKSSLVAIALLLNGCGGDNAHDGTGLGGASSSSQTGALASLQTNVMLSHANAFKGALESLESQVASAGKTDLAALQNTFVTVVKEWKSVQATYVAADYSSSMIDIPQFVDYFHTGKKLNVGDDIENALNQSGDISAALFKNSSKSINALEYLLYGTKNTSSRRTDALKVVISNLKSKATTIASFYQSNTSFSSNETDASNAIVNVLIDSTFKLKEWRIGEASGIALKFKDNPDASRLEYATSKLSLEGIKAIVKAHQDVMGERSYGNFGSFAAEHGAGTVVTQIRTQLNTILVTANAFNVPLEDAIGTAIEDAKVKKLYNEVKALQELYFTSLIQALNLTAEIIEADGD